MHDIFLSYARCDDKSGEVRAFKEALAQEFKSSFGKGLRIFFDTEAIQSADEWELRIGKGLRTSRMLIACRSSAYFASEWCRREWQQFLEHERDLGLPGDGIAPVYLKTQPSDDPGIAEWVADLSGRQQIDFRSYQTPNGLNLGHPSARETLRQLSAQIEDRLERARRLALSPTTVPQHNANFCGRSEELRTLRQMLLGGRVGSVGIIHGLGGIGKSAIAFEYSHLTAAEYPGGRWFATCEGRHDLREVFINLAGALRITFTGGEQLDTDASFARVCAEIGSRGRALVVLDNVDQPALLDPIHLHRINGDSIHLLATTRLAPEEIRNENTEPLVLRELSLDDSVRLMEKHRGFKGDEERQAAKDIAKVLGGFTLSVEAVAAYLRAETGVDFGGVLQRLRGEGFAAVEAMAGGDKVALTRHREKLLSVTLSPTLSLLKPAEKITMLYASQLPSESIPLPWLKELVGKLFPESTAEPAAGYPAPWEAIVNRLEGLQLVSPSRDARIRRMHRMVAACVIRENEKLVTPAPKMSWIRRLFSRPAPAPAPATTADAVILQVESRIDVLCQKSIPVSALWELEPLRACAQQWLDEKRTKAPWLADRVSRPLGSVVGDMTGAANLLRQATSLLQDLNRVEGGVMVDDKIVAMSIHLAQTERLLGNFRASRQHFQNVTAAALTAMRADDPRLVQFYLGHAELENDANHLQEAIDLNNKALDIEQNTNAPRSEILGRICTNLSGLALKAGVSQAATDPGSLEKGAQFASDFGWKAIQHLALVTLEDEDGVLHASTLACAWVACGTAAMSVCLHLSGLLPGHLDWLVHFRQSHLLPAFPAKGDGFATGQLFTDNGAVDGMTLPTNHRLKPPHGQITAGEEVFEQALEQHPHRGRRIGAKVEHEIEFARALLFQAEAADLSAADLVAGVVPPLVSAGEGLRITH